MNKIEILFLIFEIPLETLRKNGRIIQPREVTDLIIEDKEYPAKKIWPRNRTEKLYPGEYEMFKRDMNVAL